MNNDQSSYERFKLTCLAIEAEPSDNESLVPHHFRLSCMRIACSMNDVHLGIVWDPQGAGHYVITPQPATGEWKQKAVFLFPDIAFDLYCQIPKGVSEAHVCTNFRSGMYSTLEESFAALKDALRRLRAG